MHHLKVALKRHPIPTFLACMSYSVVLLKSLLMVHLGQGPCSHQSVSRGNYARMQQDGIHVAIYVFASGLNADTPHSYQQRCLATLYVLAPPYACTLKPVCTYTLVGGSSSKSTHSWSRVPYWIAKSACCMSQPHCAMIAVPIVFQSVAVRACA